MERLSKKNILFWKKQKVLITGHTGFKGSWLNFYLDYLGAKIVGVSLKPRKQDIIFKNSKLKKKIKNYFYNVTNKEKLFNIIKKENPSFIIHMAAQPLVLEGYTNPYDTYDINFRGTLNILECIRLLKIKNSIIVTTDKVYKNNNKKKNNFKESDLLGGSDPYSHSKSLVENLVNTYNSIYFNKLNINVVTARAGNVIGGGDRSPNRIIPDYFDSLYNKKKFILRSPNAVRPWQHILELLTGYLKLGAYLNENKITPNNSSWNFSSNKIKNTKVIDIIKYLDNHFKRDISLSFKKSVFKEKLFLNIDSSKSNKLLKWQAQFSLNECLDKIIIWEQKFSEKKNVDKICLGQILEYSNQR